MTSVISPTINSTSPAMGALKEKVTSPVSPDSRLTGVEATTWPSNVTSRVSSMAVVPGLVTEAVTVTVSPRRRFTR